MPLENMTTKRRSGFYDYIHTENFFSELGLEKNEIRNIFSNHLKKNFDRHIMGNIMSISGISHQPVLNIGLDLVSDDDEQQNIGFKHEFFHSVISSYADDPKHAAATDFLESFSEHLRGKIVESPDCIQNPNALGDSSSPDFGMNGLGALAVTVNALLPELCNPVTSAIGLTVALFSLLILSITNMNNELYEQLERKIKEEQDKIDKIYQDDLEKAKEDEKKRTEAIRTRDGRINSLDKTKKDKDKKKKDDDQVKALLEEYYVGIVDRIWPVYYPSGNAGTEVSQEVLVDAIKIKILITTGESSGFYENILAENSTPYLQLNEMTDGASYMFKIYTKQTGLGVNSWRAFKCEIQKNQEAPSQGILAASNLNNPADLQNGQNAIVDIIHPMYPGSQHLVLENDFGYLAKIKSKLLEEDEFTTVLLLEAAALAAADALKIAKTIFDPQVKDLKTLIQEALRRVKSASSPLMNMSIRGTKRSLPGTEEIEEISEALKTSLIANHIQYLSVYNVGQGSCVGLAGPDRRNIIYYDFGFGSGGFQKGYVSDVKANILTNASTSALPIIILSHWDYDHYKLAFAKRQVGTKFVAQFKWIYPFTRKTGVTVGRLLACIRSLNRSLKWPRSFEWPEGSCDEVVVNNLHLKRAIHTNYSTNDTGICLLIKSPKKDEDLLLHTADANFAYQPYPGFSGNILFASHHGSIRSLTQNKNNPSDINIPRAKLGLRNTLLIYSYGKNNCYGHDRQRVQGYYASKDWTRTYVTAEQSLRGSSPYVIDLNTGLPPSPLSHL